MFDIRNIGNPASNYENMIRASRVPAPSQEEFELELMNADIMAERAAEMNRQVAEKFRGGVQGLIQDERNRPFRWWERNEPRPPSGILLPKVRGAEQIGRDISRQSREANDRRTPR